MKEAKAPGVRNSSGNVFADLRLPDPEEALVKAQLAQRLARLVSERGLTQVQAVKLQWWFRGNRWLWEKLNELASGEERRR